MAALHGWQPRLGTGLNIFQNTNNGQSLTLVNTPTEVALEGTAFSPEIMNELEQAIANSEIINFSAAPTASTPGALGQFGAFDGMVYYCTGVSISMSYGALSAGTYYFYAQNLPYSFTLSGASAGLSFNGATLTSGGSPVKTNCWPQGTQITMADNSTYQWAALTPAGNTIPISDELAQALGLASGATVSDALQKLEGCVYQQSDGSLIDAKGQYIGEIVVRGIGEYEGREIRFGQGTGSSLPVINFYDTNLGGEGVYISAMLSQATRYIEIGRNVQILGTLSLGGEPVVPNAYSPGDSVSFSSGSSVLFPAEIGIGGADVLSVYINLPKSLDNISSVASSLTLGSFGYIDEDGYHGITGFTTKNTFITNQAINQIRIDYNVSGISAYKNAGHVRLTGLTLLFS